jgi:Spy/CpxP family protein refolding chaperone
MASEQRFKREGTTPRLAEKPAVGPRLADLDPSELLDRIERQAAEAGRLASRVHMLERTATAERDARRRLAATLKKEREAAAALHARAERDAAAHSAVRQEVERLRQAAAVAEHEVQHTWARLGDAERRLAWEQRPLWQRLLRRRPPGL